jgi:hypothetical protein
LSRLVEGHERQLVELERMARSSVLEHRKMTQAHASLLALMGRERGNRAACETTPDTVYRWRSRFVEATVEGVGVIAPGRGRKPGILPKTMDAIVHDTLHAIPDEGSTHWSRRTMAERFGVGKDAVARIWRARNIMPWPIETFKPSADPDFEAKLTDVVGLNLNPPAFIAVHQDASYSPATLETERACSPT